MTEGLSVYDIEFLQTLYLEIFDEHRAVLTAEEERDILYAVGLLEHRCKQTERPTNFDTCRGVDKTISR